MAGTESNPYTLARNHLVSTFYPTPTPGFDGRLITLLGITSYLFAITSLFLILYVVSLRRQGKPVWAWRFIQKPEGKYIMANIYVASIVPNLVTAILLGALIQNTRDIYVKGGSQYHAFLWRNIAGLVIWLQGWISTFSNVQAVLIISTKSSRSSKLPKWINIVYVVVPTMIGVGLLISGILTSSSWDFVLRKYELLLPLLLQAATLSESSDPDSATQLASINQTMQIIGVTMGGRLEIFYHQYIGLLSLWSVASIVLVGVNCAGIVLIFQLHKQMKFQAPASICNSMQEVPTRPKMGIRSWSFADSFKGSEKGDNLPPRKHSTTLSVATSGSGEAPSALADNPSLRPFWTSNVKRDSVSSKPNNTRAMRKLERDLIITITGVTFLSVLFTVDTIFFAIKQRAVAFDWHLAEIALTLIVWAYVIVLSIVVTLLTINQIVFLSRSNLKTASTILPSSFVRSVDSQDQKNQIQDRKLLTQGIQIQINSTRQISFDQIQTPSPTSQTNTLNFNSYPSKDFTMNLNGYNPRGTLRSEWDKEISPIMKGRKASWASSMESEASWTR